MGRGGSLVVMAGRGPVGGGHTEVKST
jgi:hypothetical protein